MASSPQGDWEGILFVCVSGALLWRTLVEEKGYIGGEVMFFSLSGDHLKSSSLHPSQEKSARG